MNVRDSRLRRGATREIGHVGPPRGNEFDDDKTSDEGDPLFDLIDVVLALFAIG